MMVSQKYLSLDNGLFFHSSSEYAGSDVADLRIEARLADTAALSTMKKNGSRTASAVRTGGLAMGGISCC